MAWCVESTIHTLQTLSMTPPQHMSTHVKEIFNVDTKQNFNVVIEGLHASRIHFRVYCGETQRRALTDAYTVWVRCFLKGGH